MARLCRLAAPPLAVGSCAKARRGRKAAVAMAESFIVEERRRISIKTILEWSEEDEDVDVDVDIQEGSTRWFIYLFIRFLSSSLLLVFQHLSVYFQQSNQRTTACIPSVSRLPLLSYKRKLVLPFPSTMTLQIRLLSCQIWPTLAQRGTSIISSSTSYTRRISHRPRFLRVLSSFHPGGRGALHRIRMCIVCMLCVKRTPITARTTSNHT